MQRDNYIFWGVKIVHFHIILYKIGMYSINNQTRIKTVVKIYKQYHIELSDELF